CAPFAWSDQCPRLLDQNSYAALATVAQQATERMKAEFGVPLALIVIDTIIAAAGFSKSGDENDAAIGQRIMRQLACLAQAAGPSLTPGWGCAGAGQAPADRSFHFLCASSTSALTTTAARPRRLWLLG